MSPSYEHIVSRGAYGEIVNNVYERMRERTREVWFGSDGSGLLTETWVRSTFFNEQQRERWQTADSRAAREDPTPSTDLFAANCWHGHGPFLSTLQTEPAALAKRLEERRQLTLHGIGDLIGEALVPEGLLRALYEVAAGLPGVKILASTTDELGRAGHGLARIERTRRVELVFDRGTGELLGSREVLVDPDADYAPPGAVIGWSSYLSREIVDSLPEGTPPVPRPPCSPAGSGRGTPVEPGFSLSTGYFTDLAPHLENWRADGVITEAQYRAMKGRAEHR